jgi:ribosomal protein S6E (S10)
MNAIQIVNEYIALHKAFDFDGRDHETVLAKMLGDVYGECRVVDDETGEYEIEIRGSESRSGNPVVFTFVDPEYESLGIAQEDID